MGDASGSARLLRFAPAYVLSLNLHRRHLTPSQLSMVGARARDYYDEQAKERQKSVGGSGKKAVPVNLPEAVKGDARDHAARAVGVSGKTIDYATKVIKSAVPEVIKAVDQGRMAVSTAPALASEPEEVQRRKANSLPVNLPEVIGEIWNPDLCHLLSNLSLSAAETAAR